MTTRPGSRHLEQIRYGHPSPKRNIVITDAGRADAQRINDERARAAAMAYLFAPLPWEKLPHESDV